MPTTSSFRASDLSRDSGRVFRTADEGPVEVTRRDGEPLVLTRKSEYEEHYAALSVAADLIAASLAPGDSPFERRLMERMPWMRFLTDTDQVQFSHDIIDVARSCAAVRDFGPFLTELAEWHATAAAVAAGLTPPTDLDWLDEPVPATDPHHV